MTEPYRVAPLAHPPDAHVRVPGSKSITNRALVTAALAAGVSTLDGALFADDTEAMLDCLAALGFGLQPERDGERITVTGGRGRLPAPSAELHARLSGTTSRFVLPLLTLGAGPYRLDGAPGLRARPMADGFAALRALGATVAEDGESGRLPVTVRGPRPVTAEHRGLDGTRVASVSVVPTSVTVSGDVSSQFLSGLLLAGPCLGAGLQVDVTTETVSEPYVEMTMAVMRAFGAHVEREAGGRRFTVASGGYRSRPYRIEPDASAASYFFAAAALTGGRVTVEGLGSGSMQGDIGFVDVLERMGATVTRSADRITVTGGAQLHGVDVDMGDLSDTAQTLAAIAPFADGPTTVRGIGFIRAKETDRVGAVVTELRRLGVDASEDDDGYTIRPGRPTPSEPVHTYDDHRMAMSFALVGLRVPGVTIADPGCVTKTFPGYFEALDQLR